MNKPKKAKDALAAEQEPKRLSLDDPAVADIALEDFVLDGETMRADVSGAVLDVSLNRAMDGASTMVALVNDPAVGEPPRSKLLNSSLFQKAVDLDLDDLTFRLSDIDLASNDGGVELDLTFEARAVAILRTFTGAMHASRADKTRAEFIKSLCDEARIKFICPDLHVKQPIAQPAPSGGGTVGSGASDQGGNVFSVGDSLAVGTTGPLDAIVKRHISTDAATGRASAAGLAVLSAIAHLPQTLLVQLGTNDTSVPGFRSVVQAVKALPGVTQIYWVNIARTPLGGTTDADLNAVLRDEADDTLQILDWKHLVSAGTVSLGDGIHPDGAGYQKRAELISRALRIVPAATGSTAAPGSHAARQSRAPGLSKTANLKIKGKPATAAQLALIQIANGVAADFKAPALAQVAMNCAAIGESTYSTIINSLGYGGVFQGQVTTGGHYFKASDTAEQAKYFLLGGKGFGGGGAIALATKNPDMDPGQIATIVEGSGAPYAFYGIYKAEALKIMEAFGASGSTSGTATGATAPAETYAVSYMFKRLGQDETQDHQPEDSWTCMRRLADEVRWRLWEEAGAIVYMTDERILRSQSQMLITPGAEGIDSVEGRLTNREGPQELTVACHARRWQAPPGMVATVEGYGKFDGPWITGTINRPSLFATATTISLHQREKALLEPAHDVAQRAASTADQPAGTEADIATAGGGSGGYVNPFHGATVSPSRVDQGVDYGIQGPIRAVGDAVVSFVGSYGGFGTYLAYRLRSGRYQGWYIYISEAITLTVRKGDTLRAGQKIANGHGGIECGWAQGPPTCLPAAKITGGYTEGQRTAAGDHFNAFMKSLGVVAGTTSGRPTVGHFPPTGWMGTNPLAWHAQDL